VPGPAINTLTLAQLKRFDVGRIDPSSRYARQFPGQKPADGERIPALVELFELVRRAGKGVRFNIETKVSPDKPAQSPDPDTFARLLVEAIRAARLSSHGHHPVVRLAHAVGGEEARARDRDRLPDRSLDPAR
jgi:glycerophosphoryl diester phosphodiesterase